MRSRDSSRTEESRSVIFTKLSETVAVDKVGPLMLLEKMELETAVTVDLLEATLVCGWEDTLVARQGWAGDKDTTEKSESRSEGILQMGWWAARMNSSRSFSFRRLAISFCRPDFSSSSLSVSWKEEKKRKWCELGYWITPLQASLGIR